MPAAQIVGDNTTWIALGAFCFLGLVGWWIIMIVREHKQTNEKEGQP